MTTEHHEKMGRNEGPRALQLLPAPQVPAVVAVLTPIYESEFLGFSLLFARMTVAAAMIPESDGFGAGELLMLLAFAHLCLGAFLSMRGAGDLVDYLRVTLHVGADKRALMDWPYR